MKAFSAISSDNSDTGGLSQKANELLKSIFSEDFIGERELQGLLTSTPAVQQTTAPTPIEPESSAPLFSQVHAELREHKITKDKLSGKIQQSY